MSSATRQVRVEALDPFHVVLRAAGAPAAVVLHTARDADQATIAFHTARQRLTRDHVAGDLVLLVRREAEPRMLFWEPLV
jgi:hypothetical protein